MEFLNIGGGELLVIVLLAIVLFGPEDILKIMRTVGGYVRKIQQMWTQMSSGLKGEFITDDMIPAEIQETIKETRDSVTEVQKTLSEIKTSAAADLDAAKDAIAGIKASAEADFHDTKATVKEIKTSLEDVTSSVETSFGEIPKAVEAISIKSTSQTSPTSKKGKTVLTDADPSNQQTQTTTEIALADIALPMTDGEQAQTAETVALGEDM
jgi:sec-independent protein translocase protein TatB